MTAEVGFLTLVLLFARRVAMLENIYFSIMLVGIYMYALFAELQICLLKKSCVGQFILDSRFVVTGLSIHVKPVVSVLSYTISHEFYNSLAREKNFQT